MTLKTQRGPWKIELDFDLCAVHVRPRGDRVWHPLAEDCPCGPTRESVMLFDADGCRTPTVVFLHVALDGRVVGPPPPPVDFEPRG